MRQARSKICTLALLVVSAAAAAAALVALAAPALADTQVIRDASGETKGLRKNGRLDIVKAAAGHRGELVQHAIVMRSKVKAKRAKERPLVAINTRGGGSSDPEYLVFGNSIFKVRKGADPKAVAEAELTSRGKRWIYRFDPAALGDRDSYGWAAITTKGDVVDVAPLDRYLEHEL